MVDITTTTTETVLPINLEDLTTGKIDGTGVFDEILKTMQVRLDDQYALNRIKGSDYSKVYLGSMESAMVQSIAFLMGKDKAYNEALLIKAQREKTEVEKCLIQAQCDKTREEIELVKQEVLESVQKVLLIQEQVKNAGYEGLILQEQDDKVIAETSLISSQNEKMAYEVLHVLPKELEKITAEVTLIGYQGDKISYEVNTLLPAEKDKIVASKELIEQQDLTEVENTSVAAEKENTQKNETVVLEAKAAIDLAKLHEKTYTTASGIKSTTALEIDGNIKDERDILEQQAIKAEHEAVNAAIEVGVTEAKISDKVAFWDHDNNDWIKDPNGIVYLHTVEGSIGAERLTEKEKARLLEHQWITELATGLTEFAKVSDVIPVWDYKEDEWLKHPNYDPNKPISATNIKHQMLDIGGTIKLQNEKIKNEAWSVWNAGLIAQGQVLDEMLVSPKEPYLDKNGDIILDPITKLPPMWQVPVAGIIGAQKTKLAAESLLLGNKATTEKGQYTNTPEGILSKQQLVYEKQAQGFDRNAEVARAKLYADAYSVQRGTDIGTCLPVQFGASNISAVLAQCKLNSEVTAKEAGNAPTVKPKQVNTTVCTPHSTCKPGISTGICDQGNLPTP